MARTTTIFGSQAQAEFFVEKDRETLNTAASSTSRKNRYKRAIKAFASCIRRKFRSSTRPVSPAYLLGISEDITEQKRIEKEQQFLAEVSVALSASLEYEQTLANVDQLVVQNSPTGAPLT